MDESAAAPVRLEAAQRVAARPGAAVAHPRLDAPALLRWQPGHPEPPPPAPARGELPSPAIVSPALPHRDRTGGIAAGGGDVANRDYPRDTLHAVAQSSN